MSVESCFAELMRNLDEQMKREREKPKKSPQGDRRLGPGRPPEGMAERRTGGERRNPVRSPRDKDNEE